MAKTPFKVEVLTPDGEVFNDEVEMISTRTAVGSIGILANHQPLLGMLDPAELRLYRPGGDVVRFAQGEGFLQTAGLHAMLLVDEVHEPSALDAANLRERLKAAQDRESKAEAGSEEARQAKREIRRCEAWLAIASA
jgi:F-type H+-transporting ATPase subunit epsilon